MYAFNFVPFFCNLEWGIHPTGSKGFVLIQQHIVLGAPSPLHPPPTSTDKGEIHIYLFVFFRRLGQLGRDHVCYTWGQTAYRRVWGATCWWPRFYSKCWTWPSMWVAVRKFKVARDIIYALPLKCADGCRLWSHSGDLHIRQKEKTWIKICWDSSDQKANVWWR